MVARSGDRERPGGRRAIDYDTTMLGRWLPVLGVALGAAAGLAYYVFFGCDSG